MVLHLSRACGLIFAAILSNPIAAQEYPTKPIRIIVTGGAGGSTDAVISKETAKFAALIKNAGIKAE